MIRSRGHCNTMGTASTMGLLAEALGTVLSPRGVPTPLGADVPKVKTHTSFGYATQVCILDEKGRVESSQVDRVAPGDTQVRHDDANHWLTPGPLAHLTVVDVRESGREQVQWQQLLASEVVGAQVVHVRHAPNHGPPSH